MLQKTTLDFLNKLKKNNNREWFQKNKNLYEQATADFSALVSNTIFYLSTLDKQYEILKPKDCVFRIYRDVRFAKDKSPFKTNMGAAFQIGGKKSGLAAFYYHLEPGNCFIGGGLWMPESDKLKKVRQEIDYNLKDFEKIITNKDFIKTFKKLSDEDKLVNPPKGYDTTNKAIEYLKLKSFVVGASINEKDFLKKDIEKKIQSIFKNLNPLIVFLNKALK